MIILTQMFGVLIVGMGGMKKAVCTHPLKVVLLKITQFVNTFYCSWVL